MLTDLDKPHNGEPSITNLIWISEWLIPLVIIYKLPLRFFRFNFLRIMVYTVITGFTELPYEQTLVPGVLITNPKKIPSILKRRRGGCVLHSLFVLLDNYSQTIYTLTSWALKRCFGGHQWNFWQWVGRTSFRFDLRDNGCLAPNEKTQTSPLSSRKVGNALPSSPPTPARVRSRVLIQAIFQHLIVSIHKNYNTRSKPKRF